MRVANRGIHDRAIMATKDSRLRSFLRALRFSACELRSRDVNCESGPHDREVMATQDCRSAYGRTTRKRAPEPLAATSTVRVTVPSGNTVSVADEKTPLAAVDSTVTPEAPCNATESTR